MESQSEAAFESVRSVRSVRSSQDEESQNLSESQNQSAVSEDQMINIPNPLEKVSTNRSTPYVEKVASKKEISIELTPTLPPINLNKNNSEPQDMQQSPEVEGLDPELMKIGAALVIAEEENKSEISEETNREP